MKKYLPTTFASRMRARLGDEYDEFVRELEEVAPVSIRYNPNKCKWGMGGEGEQVPWCEDAFYLPERPRFTFDPFFHAGRYYVQEASSMFVGEAVRQLFEGGVCRRALDLCAAPGGKSTLLASALPKEALLVGNEVIRSRYHILRENISKWGQANVCTTHLDPKGFSNIKDWFDLILVDAPCSGEGLFRKNDKATAEWSENNVGLCAARQKRILGEIVGSLSPGGFLLYSTCTYNDNENDHNVKWLSDNYDLKIRPLDISAFDGIVATEYGCQFYPHRVKGEGFYIAAFQKKGTPKKRKKDKRTKPSPLLDKKNEALLQQWIRPGDWKYSERDNGNIHAIPEKMWDDIIFLKNHLPFVDAGVYLGNIMKRKFVPSHELAMSLILEEGVPSLEVDRQQALEFLSKNEIGNLEMRDLPKGWLLVKYKNAPLGWVKALGNRMNNYYPKAWRIRKAIG